MPLTEAEIAYAGKKLKPIIYEDLVRIAEVDGEPVAFMITIPDINELTADLDGRLFPFGWAKLLWRLRKPRTRRVAGAADGGRQEAPRHPPREPARLHADRISSAATAVAKFGATHGEFGWILEDNKGMLSIAELPGAEVNTSTGFTRKRSLGQLDPRRRVVAGLSPGRAPSGRRRRRAAGRRPRASTADGRCGSPRRAASSPAV